MANNRLIQDEVVKALDAAHAACLRHPNRGPTGMSSGPFSGVNFALEMVATLEEENHNLRARCGLPPRVLAERERFGR